MTHVGIDIEQFTRDPYGSGIQRVLQYLAIEWPTDGPSCHFVLPHPDGHVLLTAQQAARVLSVPFAANTNDAGQIRALVQDAIQQEAGLVVQPGSLISMFDRWLLPEVSYLPSVLARSELFAECMPVTMIGYDALPMIEPANYRFPPGSAARVSQYFRMLVRADSVVCISEYSRASIWERLRRDRSKVTTVAHPGGDHIEPAIQPRTPSADPTLIKVGTLEARKKPIETIEAFRLMRDEGWTGRLTLLGRPSASDPAINRAVTAAAAADEGITWIQDARDEDVLAQLREADLFIAVGTEGYGIPVLEAISQGVPVAYHGIQPAAEIMRGSGATPIDATDGRALADSLTRTLENLPILKSEINVSTIPTWRDFVAGVVAVL